MAVGLAVTVLAACATASEPAPGYLASFRGAETLGRPFTPVTDTAPQLSPASAYRIQDQLVAARLASGDRVAGFKGGLMSAGSLSAKHVSEPLTGVLFASGLRRGGEDVSLCGYRRAAFEAKLGFRFRTAITRPVASIEALVPSVSAVLPVIDLPDIAYRDPDRYSAIDMIAADITAALFVEGAGRDPRGIDLDALTVNFEHDGQVVAHGAGRESLGSQWESLRTLVNLIVARGGRIEPGQVVLTGKIGDKGWLTPGAYHGDFGPLGTVDFRAVPCPGR
jgi:2-keto-4-pentenoate hydratase